MNEKKRILFHENGILTTDLFAIVDIIWFVILGIHISFWEITITPFSFASNYSRWSMAWIFGRFIYYTAKKLKKYKQEPN